MVSQAGNLSTARPAGEEDPITSISIDEHGTIREERRESTSQAPRGGASTTNAANPGDVRDGPCEHITNPVKDSRNLIVCIDGTANQFGLQVRAHLYCFNYQMPT